MAKYANFNDFLSSLNGQQLPTDLPDYLKQQIFQAQSSSGGDSTPTSQWSYKGDLKDSQGREVIQLGDNYDPTHLIDKGSVWDDPDLGKVTLSSNVDHSHDHDGPMKWLNPATGILSVLTAGLAGPALADAIGGFGGSTAATTGAFDVGGSTGFGGINPLVDAAGGATPSTTGAFDTGGFGGPGSATLPGGEGPSSGIFDSAGNPLYTSPDPTTGAFDNFASSGPAGSTPVFDSYGNYVGGQPSLWDEISGRLSNLSPTSLLKAIPALATATKPQGRPTGGPTGLGNMGGGTSRAGAPSFGGGRTQADFNPYGKARGALPIKTLGDYLKGND